MKDIASVQDFINVLIDNGGYFTSEAQTRPMFEGRLKDHDKSILVSISRSADRAVGLTSILCVPAGSEGGGPSYNAVVPENAIIQPPQAYVDAMAILTTTQPDSVALPNLGITHLDPVIFAHHVRLTNDMSYDHIIDLSGNALTQAAVDAILHFWVDFNNGTLDLSGGTNSAPSPAGVADAAQMDGQGWTVTLNNT
jgi:hypothetical protein